MNQWPRNRNKASLIREWNKARGKLEKSCWVGNTAEGKRMRNGLVGTKIQRNQSS